MTDSRWTPSPDDEELRPPQLPPTPSLPEPPKAEFERPKLHSATPSPTFQRNTRAIGVAFSVGFALAGPVILGALLGYWLDGRLGTSPTWTMILTLLGIVAGLVQLIRIASKLNRLEDKP
ncbi:MAG: AtpZ/AtpI family protein [Fimbriimonadales bacterium]|nr:AtpZ/AtpI family protein [Fimbriimonadales bacterium]